MIDPITALAAVNTAVNLVKKTVATVQNIESLGPVLGKYFDAKSQAVEVVEKAKSGQFKGSALGKALELEMALEQAREFEEQIKMLFFQSNKMDVWMKIKAREAEMNRAQLHAQRRAREAQARKKKESEEATTIVLLLLVVAVVLGTVGWFVFETMDHCGRVGCGR